MLGKDNFAPWRELYLIGEQLPQRADYPIEWAVKGCDIPISCEAVTFLQLVNCFHFEDKGNEQNEKVDKIHPAILAKIARNARKPSETMDGL